MTTIVRRRRLGMSSVKNIVRFSKTGMRWARNDLGIPVDDTYIRWGCTANLPNPRAKVFNKAKAIHQVCDKTGFRRTLQGTELAPETWFDYLEVPPVCLLNGVIVRRAKHAQGRGLWVARTPEELLDAVYKAGRGYYISQLIDKVAEYRVFVVQGRVACVAQKTPGNPQDVAWNVAKGGRFDNVRWGNWPLKAVRCAIEAFNLSDLDFGGVDVMVDNDGHAYVIEINSAPSLTSPYRQECMAKALDYLTTVSPERIPLVDKLGNWKKFIHPAVSDRALIQEAA